MAISRNRLCILGFAAVGIVSAACSHSTSARPSRTAPVAPMLGTSATLSTSRADLERASASMELRLAKNPADSAAAVTLAEVLLRQTRVLGNAGLALRAEAVLAPVLKSDPLDYGARRMLAAVYLSQHRFRDAIREGERCRAARGDDAWVYGVIGDGYLELGEYKEAFAAFDRMLSLRPNAAAYGRAAYARELQGDLTGAVKLMQMALEATSPHDAESLAWHHAQLGHLHLAMGHLAQARREYEHADFTFPGHPFASDGLAHVKAEAGDFAGAYEIVKHRLMSGPTPSDLAFAGDLLAALGRQEEAERNFQLAEAGWRTDAPEPSRLARFLADHNRRVEEAIRIAEQAAADRHDIFTQDALAWAYFKGGQIDRARSAIALALKTGTSDRDIRRHAAAIEQAVAGPRPESKSR